MNNFLPIHGPTQFSPSSPGPSISNAPLLRPDLATAASNSRSSPGHFSHAVPSLSTAITHDSSQLPRRSVLITTEPLRTFAPLHAEDPLRLTTHSARDLLKLQTPTRHPAPSHIAGATVTPDLPAPPSSLCLNQLAAPNRPERVATSLLSMELS
jgi:hypothetical protein